MRAFSCGIDFGTSNSAIAVNVKENDATLVSLESDNETIPSAVFYPAKNNVPVFGNAAVAAYTGGEHGRFMRSLKRVLGTPIIRSGTVVNGDRIGFDVILSAFIQRMKETAEQQCGGGIDDVVMGRPVHFRDHDLAGDRRAEKELEQIAKQVGFKNIAFQYEPIAAAFAHEKYIDGEKLALVVDIGGGTSDFTIIRLSQSYINKSDRQDDILANTGVRVGGNDFDMRLCLESFMPEFGLGTTYGPKRLEVPRLYFLELSEWSKVNMVYTHANIKAIETLLVQSHDPQRLSRLLHMLEEETGHILLGEVEEAKINLTSFETDERVLDFVAGGPVITSDKRDFERSIQAERDTIIRCVRECLSQAHIKPDAVELVILTGGSTEIPALQSDIREMFSDAVLSQENKMSSVGLGLAYDAKRRF